MSNFDQDQQLFHAGDNVTVSSGVGGNSDFASNLANPRSKNWDVSQEVHLTLGSANLRVAGYLSPIRAPTLVL